MLLEATRNWKIKFHIKDWSAEHKGTLIGGHFPPVHIVHTADQAEVKSGFLGPAWEQPHLVCILLL